MSAKQVLAVIAACVALHAAAQTPAQTPTPTQTQTQTPAQAPAQRPRELADAARREGTLTLYSSMVDKDLRRLVAEFERRYAVRVNVWRSGKAKVLQRVVAEARAGRNEVDVVHNPSVAMEALHREKLLQPVDSPLHATLIPEAVAPHREWAGPRVYIFVNGFNTAQVKREELPRSYADLLDPRWKGRLSIEGKEQEWFVTLVRAMGEEKGMRFFRELVATNGISVRMGNSQIVNLIAAGEVPFALALYSYLPEQAKRAGAPVDWVALAPTVAATDAIGIAKRAPHPNAALLFYEFMLGDGLAIMEELGHVVSSRARVAQLAPFNLTFIDPAVIISDYDRWTRLYEETLQGRAPVATPSRTP